MERINYYTETYGRCIESLNKYKEDIYIVRLLTTNPSPIQSVIIFAQEICGTFYYFLVTPDCLM